MTDATRRALSSNKKKRGTTRASITRINTRLRELEDVPDLPATIGHAQRLIAKLQTLAEEFKVHHFAVIDLIDDEEELAAQQTILDNLDDDVSQITAGLEVLTTKGTSTTNNVAKVALKRLRYLERGFTSVSDSLESLDEEDNTCILQQHRDRLTDMRKELSDIRQEFLSVDHEDTREFDELLDRLEQTLFDLSLKIRKLLRPVATATAPTLVDTLKPVKLPKLDVPTFDGNILNWTTFWEQFDISIHSRSDLATAEKLAYLRNALKNGSAKNAIEGLSRSGEQYEEAVSCLKDRYDKPRLIHQAHVRKIVEIPSLKDGNGKELRRLHDTAQQHLRALKALGHEPDEAFITSMIELKLDGQTMFEWQRHSQDSTDVPPYQELLDFINLRAQASENSSDFGRKIPKGDTPIKKPSAPTKHITSYTSSFDPVNNNCVVCKEKHPLYLCAKFKSMTHDEKRTILKSNGLCMNCMRSGHFVKRCKSLHKCHVCQKPHHTLLHVEKTDTIAMDPPSINVSSNTVMKIRANTLLMTCYVKVKAPDGSVVTARALLDSASSASFVTERLAQALSLPRSRQNTHISGVTGITRTSPLQSVARFSIVTTHPPGDTIDVIAIVSPMVTCDLPLAPISVNLSWDHLSDIPLADPDFAHPGRVDILLGVDVFAAVLLNGRRCGPPGSPVAFETKLGWVLAGNTNSSAIETTIVSHHTTHLTGDDLLRKFWELEENPAEDPILTPEETAVVKHFETHHFRSKSGRFTVPLPRKPDSKPLGESRMQAVRRFTQFERSLHSKGAFPEFKAVVDEYFDMGHAEPVPESDLEKPPQQVFYLPMHAVMKDSSTTTKIRAVFDASAKTSTGISLNDNLLVGPTVHSSLVDVLLRFRFHRVALIADVSRMYRAIELVDEDKDLHRFVWRNSPTEVLRDYRITRITFGVSASSFIANMCVKQNASDHALEFPLASQAVRESFYVDDGLTGADSIEMAIRLQRQLQKLFERGGFLLRKWNSSEATVLESIDPELRAQQSLHMFTESDEYTKTLGVEWSACLDQFRLVVTKLSPQADLTKRILISDIAKIFDVLGWIAPVTVKAKILLQRLWEEGLHWDDSVPENLQDTWLQWRSELPRLKEKLIPRCYFPKEVEIVFKQLHGFSDASERAYAGVVYLRLVNTKGHVYTSLVMAKTKVAPIKKLTIPRLELCGARLLAQLLHHCQTVFEFPVENVFAWTDSTIVLNWISVNPRRFKTYVGNRVLRIVELIPPNRWNHVEGIENPADCASRGLQPSELLSHKLWWEGPNWLQLGIQYWPLKYMLPQNPPSDEVEEICSHLVIVSDPILPCDQFSSFTRFARVTTWVKRFLHNCHAKSKGLTLRSGPLTVPEMEQAETYWLCVCQADSFSHEIEALKKKTHLLKSSRLLSLRPFIDDKHLLRVGGRQQNSQLPYDTRHPVILHGSHPISKLLIRREHTRLLHAGPLLVSASLSSQFHFIGGRKSIRSITRSCVICRRKSLRPEPPMMGQLPKERVTPDTVFSRVGLDYAGPVYIKHGYVRKPVVVKAYICVFVSLSVKAVHIELVSDLTSEAFIACLRRFIARRGKPTLIWSDHGTNFVGAARQIKELYEFLRQTKTSELVTNFCTTQKIKWEFIPERAPHFGGLWEAAVKSLKKHLSRIVGTVKLTFEEMTTVLTQIEACLNSRPLTCLPCDDDDGIQVLTPGHFLIGRPLEALANPGIEYRSLTLLKRWHLCQVLVKHLWERWSKEYLSTLQRVTKWLSPSTKISVGDIVIVREDNVVPTNWPLARIVKIYPGRDGVIRVVTVRTSSGNEYTRPVVKIAPLLT